MPQQQTRLPAAVLKSEAEIPCQMLHAMIVVVVPLMWTVRRRNVLLTEKKNVMQTKSRLQVLLPLEVLTQNVEALSWNDKEIKKTPGRLLQPSGGFYYQTLISPSASETAKSRIRIRQTGAIHFSMMA